MHWLAHPLSQIGLASIGMSIVLPICAVIEYFRPTYIPSIIPFALTYALPIAVVLWMAAEARQRRETPCFDFTFWLILFWPMSLFWWCMKTRGWRGLLLALGVLVLINIPAFLATVVDVFRVLADTLAA